MVKIEFGGALLLLLLGLKLGGVIGWSWWWTTAPLWGWIAILLAILLGALLVLGAVGICEAISKR